MSKEDKKIQKHLVDEMMKVYETNPDVMIYMQSLMENYEKLQQRIDKAIEYIKEHQEKQFAFNFEYALRDNEIDVLLEILGDKE